MYSILKLSGFRARMATAQGRKIIRGRRKKGRKNLAIQKSSARYCKLKVDEKCIEIEIDFEQTI